MKKILVIGASPTPSRYAYKATRMLQDYNYDVYALGKRAGKIGDIAILTEPKTFSDIDTISLYLNRQNSEGMKEYILGLNPKRIIINPGSENPLLEKEAKNKGIEITHGCTLVMLSSGTFEERKTNHPSY